MPEGPAANRAGLSSPSTRRTATSEHGVAGHHDGPLPAPEGGDGVDRARPGHGVERRGHQPAGTDRDPALLHDAVGRGDLQRDHRLQRGAHGRRDVPAAADGLGQCRGGGRAGAAARRSGHGAGGRQQQDAGGDGGHRGAGGQPGGDGAPPPGGRRAPHRRLPHLEGTPGDDDPRTSEGWRQSRSSGGSHPRSVASCVASPEDSAPGRGRSPPFPSSRCGSSGPSSEGPGPRGVTARQVTDAAGGFGVAPWPYDWADVP